MTPASCKLLGSLAQAPPCLPALSHSVSLFFDPYLCLYVHFTGSFLPLPTISPCLQISTKPEVIPRMDSSTRGTKSPARKVMKSTLSHSILACCISRMLLSFDSVNLQPKHVEPPSDETSKLYNRASSPTWYCRERFSTSAMTAEVKAIHWLYGRIGVRGESERKCTNTRVRAGQSVVAGKRTQASHLPVKKLPSC